MIDHNSKESQIAILSAAPISIYTINLNGYFTFWSYFASNYFGYSVEDIVRKRHYSFLFPDKSTVKEIIKTVDKYGIYRGEVIVLKKDGTIHPNELTLTKLFDQSGAHTGYIGVNSDITKQKRLEADYESSLQKSRAIFDQTFQFIGLMTPEGILIEANKTALKFAGIKESDVLGKPFWKTPWWTHSRVMQEKLRSAIKEAREGKFVRFEATHPARDGSIRDVDFSLKPVKNEKGKVIFLIPEGRDITERKRIEEALRESEIKYRSLFEGTSEGIIVADVETKGFKYANPAFCKMLGYTARELQKMRILDIHPKESLKKVLSEFGAQAKGEKELSPYLPCLKKNGTIIYCDINSAPITIDGRLCNVGFFTDITEKMLLEQKHLELSRLAVIGTFSASIAHEIRNPLFSIAIIAQTIERRLVNPENRELLSAMLSEIERLKSFINDILYYSRPQKTVIKKIFPVKILEQVIKTSLSLIKSKKIKLKLLNSKDIDLLSLSGDNSQIYRLFLNLIINSIEASKKSSLIAIKVKPLPPDSRRKLEISFHNMGSYIKKDNLHSVFDLFFSTKSKGCGLGLAICKKIIEQHDGSISVKSSKANGTTFTVQL